MPNHTGYFYPNFKASIELKIFSSSSLTSKLLVTIVMFSIVSTVVVMCICLRKFYRKAPSQECLVSSDIEDNESDTESGFMNQLQEEIQGNLTRRTSYKIVSCDQLNCYQTPYRVTNVSIISFCMIYYIPEANNTLQ